MMLVIYSNISVRIANHRSQQTHITGESLTDDTEVPGTAVVAISHHEGGSFDRQAIIEDAVMTTKAKLFCYFRWNFFGSKQWLRTAKLPKAGADPDLDDFLQSIDSMYFGTCVKFIVVKHSLL